MIFLKLLSAALCGLIIGIERKLRQKTIGLKTMVLISVGSMLFTESALLVTGGDPLRMTSQIVTGVGFLGAGVIIRGSNDRISGLTTAALVWVSSSLGILSGLGYFMYAIGIAISIISLLFTLGFIENKLFRK